MDNIFEKNDGGGKKSGSKLTQKDYDQVINELKERVKEQACLYNISSVDVKELSEEIFFNKIIEYLQQAFQFPELAEIAVLYKNNRYTSKGYKKKKWDLVFSSEIGDGNRLEVRTNYRKKPKTPELFLPEEKLFLDTLTDLIAFKLSQKEVHLKRERDQNTLEKTLNQSLDVICTINERGEFVNVSEASKNVWGYEPEELTGKLYMEMVHPDDHELTLRVSEEIMAGKEFTNFHNRYLRKDGSTVDIIWSAKWDNKDKLMYCIAKDATELNRAKLEMELLINNTDESFVLLDKDLNIVSFNHQFEKLCREHMGIIIKKGEYIIDHTPHEKREEVKKRYERVLKGVVEETTLTFQDKENREKIYAIRHQPARDQHSVIIGAFVTSVDVTKEVQIRRELERSNERYEYVTQATSDAIWDFAPKTGNLFWGEGFKTLFGYERGVKKGVDRWMGNIHPDDIERIKNFVEKLLSGGETEWDQEYRFKKMDGNYAYVRDKAVIVLDESGKPERVIGAMEDITQKKQEEEQLKLMESVVMNTTDAVIITKAEPMEEPYGPEIVYVNEAFEIMTGYKSEEVIGKTPRLLQGPNTDYESLKEFDEKLKRWETAEAEIINYKKNGEEFWVQFTMTPLADEKGKYTHWIAVERDVTGRKNREIKQKLISEISQIFNETEGLRESVKKTLTKLKDIGNFRLAELWLISHDNKSIELTTSLEVDAEIFYDSDNGIEVFKYGEGLPGKIWKSGKSQFWKNLEKRKSFVRSEAAKKAGLKTAYGLPIKYNNKMTGALLLGIEDALKKPHFYTPILEDIAIHLGEEIQRKILEEELSRIFTSAPDGIVVAGFDGYLKKVNPAMCEILGYTEEELLSTPFIDFVHLEDRERTVEEYEKANAGSDRFNFENRYVKKSGKVIWLSWTFKVFPEEEIAYSVAKDITDQKELQELFDQASRLARIGSWEVDLVKEKMYWAEITRQIHEVGLDYEPVLESAISFYKEGESREKINRAVFRAKEEGEPFDLELQIVTAKDNERWIRAIGEADMADGKCVRIYGSLQDIHNQKVVEEKLKEKTSHIDAIAQLNAALLNYRDWFGALDRHLGVVGEAVQADRVYYFENRFDPDTGEGYTTQKLEWCREGIKAQLGNPDLDEIPFSDVPELVDPMIDRKQSTRKLSDVPKGSVTEYVMLDQQMKTFLAIPIYIKDHFHGFVGFDNCTIEKDWSDEEITTLKTIASNLAIAIERQKADEDLQSAFEEKNTILESIGDAFFAVDTDWIVTYWNRMAEEVLGLPREKIIGGNLWDLYEDVASLRFHTQYHKAVNEQVIVHFEEFYPALEKWFEVTAYPSESGLSIFFKDVTGQKKSQKQLIERTRQLDAIAMFNSLLIKEDSWQEALEKSFPAFGELVNCDRVYYFKNVSALDGEQTISMTKEWVKEGILPQIDNPDHQSLPHTEIWDFIEPLINRKPFNHAVKDIKNKEFRKLLESQDIKSLLALPVFTGSEFQGFIGFDDCTTGRTWREEEISFLKTITINLASAIENEDAEEALQKAFEEKNEILESIGDGFFAVGEDFSVNYWNNMAEELLFTPKEKVIGKNLWNLFDKEQAKESYRHYSRALKERKALKFEDYYEPIDRWFDVNVYPSSNGISVFFKDITERKKADEKLRELNQVLEHQAKELAVSNAELEQFAFVASHDLQEPLRMITGFLAQLERKYDDVLDEKGRKYIHFATDGAKRMRQIILDLLEYSRVGRVDSERTGVNIAEVLNDVMMLNRKLIEEKKATVTWGEMPEIYAAKAPIQQLFQNLVNNALNYQKGDNKPVVKISAEDEGSHWKFSVQDNGIGINPEYTDKIFNIFQRLHGKEEYSGTGVGLAICKKIVEDHGGKIGVDSSEGEGSTFYFTIPKNQGEVENDE